MARYLVAARTLFQHIPRTGGTYVERVIDEIGIRCVRWLEKQPLHVPRKHALLSHYWRSNMAEVETVCAVVRHPVDYYVSVYRHLVDTFERPARFERRIGRYGWHPHADAIQAYQPGMTLSIWTRTMLTRHPGWVGRLMELYVGPRGGEFANWIGRTETLTTDLVDLLDRLGYGHERGQAADRIEALGRVNVAKALSGDLGRSETAMILRTEAEFIDRFYGEQTKNVRFYQATSSLDPTPRIRRQRSIAKIRRELGIG